MLNRVPVLVAAAVAALLLMGCGKPPLRPYQTLTDLDAASRQADLVVEGAVSSSDDVEHIPGADVWSNINGRLGQDCIVLTRVKLSIVKVVKGPADAKEVTFSFYSPCFHGDPQVLLGLSLPPVLTQGAWLRTYLVRRENGYWLIAHERLPPSARPQDAASAR